MFFFKRPSPVPNPPGEMAVATNPPPTPAPAPVSVRPPVTLKTTVAPADRQQAIAQETEQLARWSMNNDPQSLTNILGDLASPEKEIRLAAIEAVKQFDDTNAIPVLRAMAANTDDHEEAAELLEAADFLELPDFVFPTAPPQTNSETSHPYGDALPPPE
jgi:hypothetical protein